MRRHSLWQALALLVHFFLPHLIYVFRIIGRLNQAKHILLSSVLPLVLTFFITHFIILPSLCIMVKVFNFNITINLYDLVPPFTVDLNFENAPNPAQKHFEKTTSWDIVTGRSISLTESNNEKKRIRLQSLGWQPTLKWFLISDLV